MILAKVIAPVVMSLKTAALQSEKVLVVRPCDAQGEPSGAAFLAIDRAQAGEGDQVIVLREGSGIRQILGRPNDAIPIRSMVVGIVDEVTSA